MMTPYRFDNKYQGMSAQEFELNYERDVALYEQTEALKKLANNQSNTSTTSTTNVPRIPYECLDPHKKENYKFINLDHKLDILENTFTPLLIITIFIAICLIPIVSYVIINLELANVLKFVILPVSIVSIILTRLRVKTICNELDNMLNEYKNRE